MNLKKFKPVTPSQRHLIQVTAKNLAKKPLLKTKITGVKNNCGKNYTGRIVSYHKGGGHKKKYRHIDFNLSKDKIGIITSIEYDPFRTANIASVYNYLDKKYEYIIASKGTAIGDIIKTGKLAEVKNGHSLPLYKIPIGSLIYNIPTKIGTPSQISRSAGAFSQLIEKTAKFGRIKLTSGEQRYIPINCYATLGIVSNELNFLTTRGKAGRSRWLNRRPHVRGVAMNPIDHPHGGGEGKTNSSERI